MSAPKPHVVLRKFNCSVLSKDFAAQQAYEPIKDVDTTYIAALVKSGFLKVKGSTAKSELDQIQEQDGSGTLMSMDDFENAAPESDTPEADDNSKEDLDALDAQIESELADSEETEEEAETVSSEEETEEETTSEEETEEEVTSDEPAPVKKTAASGLESIKDTTDKKDLIPVAKYFKLEVKGNLGDANYKKALVEALEALAIEEAK
jgi:hypothetical protein